MVYILWPAKVTNPSKKAIYAKMQERCTLENMIHALILLFILLVQPTSLAAQTPIQHRVWLSDKGVSDGVLSPGSPGYETARSLISDRALDRRRKTVPESELLTTEDLPLYNPYVDQIESTGVPILQRSRWFNTVLVVADSATADAISRFPFVDSVQQLGVYSSPASLATPVRTDKLATTPTLPGSRRFVPERDCITERYGRADSQLRRIGADYAHMVGVSGNGVLIGILDAGFDWRGHVTLAEADVVAEYDFVNDDPRTFDEPGQTNSRSHGTLVMSVIAADVPDTMFGVAPHASFALAKTEDVGSETPVEEDNFVAGLEWLESLGADITNTSLGYTTFDPPYFPHGNDLDGSTAFASRAVNHAAGLGVVCIVSAGNEFRSFRRVGVPAEADSAVAVAALDENNSPAPFSSQGSGDPLREKPDIAAPGVRIWGADADDSESLISVQGTSLAAPLVTGAAALVLSARPSLSGPELRSLLLTKARELFLPDTAAGAGLVSISDVLIHLTQNGGAVGTPTVESAGEDLVVGQWAPFRQQQLLYQQSAWDSSVEKELIIENRMNGAMISTREKQRIDGFDEWLVENGVADLDLEVGDSLTVTVREVARMSQGISIDVLYGDTESTRCRLRKIETPVDLALVPNPVNGPVTIEVLLMDQTFVTLDLYNTRGEQIERLFEDVLLESGRTTIRADLSELEVGAYYYRILLDETVYSWPVWVVR